MNKIKSEKEQYKKLLDKLKRSGEEMPCKEAIEQECCHFKILHRVFGSSAKANPRFILDPSKRTKSQPSNSQPASSVNAEGETLKEVTDDEVNDSLEQGLEMNGIS